MKEVRLMGAVNVKFENNKAVMISRDLRYAKERGYKVYNGFQEGTLLS